MTATFNHYQLILDELKGTLSHVKDEEFDGFASGITEASRIFVTGKGCSGLVANSFTTRLNQLGKQAFVIGESTTPSTQKGDLFIVISGSDSTEHLRLLANKAKSVEAEVILLTTKLDFAVGEIADVVVELSAGTEHDVTGSNQPLGSLFRQSSQILLDNVVTGLTTQLDVGETTMQSNHTNSE